MSEEVDKTKTETENGIPETSTSEEKECNGGSNNVAEESNEPSSKNSSRFGSIKMKALHAKEGISTKVGGLKEKFARLKRKSEESVSSFSFLAFSKILDIYSTYFSLLEYRRTLGYNNWIYLFCFSFFKISMLQ